MIKKMIGALVLVLCAVVCANAQDSNEKKNIVLTDVGPPVSIEVYGEKVLPCSSFSYPAGLQYGHNFSDMWTFYVDREFFAQRGKYPLFTYWHKDE